MIQRNHSYIIGQHKIVPHMDPQVTSISDFLTLWPQCFRLIMGLLPSVEFFQLTSGNIVDFPQDSYNVGLKESTF